VLGHGLSKVHPPTNERLAAKIVQNGGLVISEFPLDMEPDVYTFPARNRIIAGLSLGTLVVEAPTDSGAMITARLSLEYGRDVFAVPGFAFDDNMAGCHRLISDGHARLVTKPEDILQELGVVHAPDNEQRVLFLPQSADQEAVYRVLSGMPQSADDIALRAGLSASGVATALTLMELAGAARNVGAGHWVRR
jgi:DNA processing protein